MKCQKAVAANLDLHLWPRVHTLYVYVCTCACMNTRIHKCFNSYWIFWALAVCVCSPHVCVNQGTLSFMSTSVMRMFVLCVFLRRDSKLRWDTRWHLTVKAIIPPIFKSSTRSRMNITLQLSPTYFRWIYLFSYFLHCTVMLLNKPKISHAANLFRLPLK